MRGDGCPADNQNGVSGSVPYQSLLDILREFGVRTIDDRAVDGKSGFPVQVRLSDGTDVYLDLPEPAILGSLDPEAFGVVVIDPLGYPSRVWGLAKRLPAFQGSDSCFTTEIGSLIEGAVLGTSGSVYLDGYRYHAAPLAIGSRYEALVVVVNAQEEKLAKAQASQSMRTAEALRRIGRSLTMHNSLDQLCLATAHEIASVADLAAVLLWTADEDGRTLRLTGRVGVNRQGSQLMEVLALQGSPTCIAELVAGSRQAFFLNSVLNHVMTVELEAKFCYLKPGGLSVHPLVISDRLLGVLELVGREDDPNFVHSQSLFQTIAEHLALALNNAMLFASFERLATHDALTGIANHRMLQEFLAQRIIEAQRGGQELGVIMIDVDHFRSFNEEEGHDAGDKVLKLVSEAIKTCLRPYDLAARYGGEEFTVVLPGSAPAATFQVAERIRKKVQSISYRTRSGRERHVSISLGTASFPQNGQDQAGLLKAADTALFNAKRQGRNRTVAYRGAYLQQTDADVVDLDRIRRWVRVEEQADVDKLTNYVEHVLVPLAKNLHLSPAQRQILRGLACAFVPYRNALAQRDIKRLRGMEESEDFRLLVPSLSTYDQPYDEESPEGRNPLLARILAVLVAVVFENGAPLLENPSRFDPEVVAAMGELEDAA